MKEIMERGCWYPEIIRAGISKDLGLDQVHRTTDREETRNLPGFQVSWVDDSVIIETGNKGERVDLGEQFWMYQVWEGYEIFMWQGPLGLWLCRLKVQQVMFIDHLLHPGYFRQAVLHDLTATQWGGWAFFPFYILSNWSPWRFKEPAYHPFSPNLAA